MVTVSRAIPMALEGSLAELEITLAECNSSLEQFDKKERFLGLRINSYRKLMQQRENLMTTLQSTTNTKFPKPQNPNFGILTSCSLAEGKCRFPNFGFVDF